MTNATLPVWEAKRTAETREVEAVLRSGFAQADAYRYNSASIRVRVIDSKFEKLSTAERDDLVEPYLVQLPEQTQADIITLFTFAPKELEQRSRQMLLNNEFEEPSPSVL